MGLILGIVLGMALFGIWVIGTIVAAFTNREMAKRSLLILAVLMLAWAAWMFIGKNGNVSVSDLSEVTRFMPLSALMPFIGAFLLTNMLPYGLTELYNIGSFLEILLALFVYWCMFRYIWKGRLFDPKEPRATISPQAPLSSQ